MTKTLDYPALSPVHVGGTELREFHLSGDPELVAVLATVPGYVDVRRKLLTLADYRPELMAPPPDPVEAMCAVIDSCLAEGRPIPPRLAEEIPADPDQVQRHNQFAGIAKAQSMRGLVAQLDGLLLGNLKVIYTWLNRSLTDVVEQARAIQSRGDRPATADEAIAADRVEDFRAVLGLEQTYARIRQLQASLVPLVSDWAISNIDGRPAAFRHYVANPIEVIGHAEIRNLDDGRTNVGEGWSADSAVPTNWHAGEAVWWFGTHTAAEPWVPTASKYAKSRAEIAAELNPTTPADREKARARQTRIDAQLAQQRRNAESVG